ncbi:DsbE family thiol:disulfide interchange protein [Pelagibacteraceae bacterium]|jgi:cytochrome c biogenesis protein CcmG/thiol:disulfide interchange protein DsbE|nr:DsbE family thiol:disulfide interchange protein [Pelagibacteraceae bacterium]|tara:strand:+ start:95 stop:607 length:513 start_codon:yes stop_codon:yes gene_type:complete
MKIIRLLIILVFIFLLTVFFVGLNKSSFYDTKDLEGRTLKNIQLDHFSRNKVISEQDLKKNNFTLINFWASWCGPCRTEHPFLLKLNDEKNLNLIGVNFKDKKINALNFLNQYGNPYDVLAKDESGKHSVNFGIYGIPESILVNKNLIIIKKFIGPISEEDLKYIKTIVK